MSAVLDASRTYRYALTRDVDRSLIDGPNGTVTFVMLNPSTADETVDDPTIRKCVKFARSWGFARLKVVNLFAYRATNPADLKAADDPVGPENDCTIAKVVGGSDLVVCAWGAHKLATPRAKEVLALVAAPHCLRLTKDGQPWHPLYIPDATQPQPFAHCHPLAAWAGNSHPRPTA